jgi:hypothetical protein
VGKRYADQIQIQILDIKSHGLFDISRRTVSQPAPDAPRSAEEAVALAHGIIPELALALALVRTAQPDPSLNNGIE